VREIDLGEHKGGQEKDDSNEAAQGGPFGEAQFCGAMLVVSSVVA
jgi:hypothetical protein